FYLYLVIFQKLIHDFLHLFQPRFPPPHRHRNRLHFENLLREDVVTVQSGRRSTLTIFPFTSALCLRSIAIL
ncbi:unnamed protein product, partial [Brassica rapa subsp. narinosa]